MGPQAIGRIWALALLLTASAQVANSKALAHQKCSQPSRHTIPIPPCSTNYGPYTHHYQPQKTESCSCPPAYTSDQQLGYYSHYDSSSYSVQSAPQTITAPCPEPETDTDEKPCVPCEEPQPCKPTYNPSIPQPSPEPKPCSESSYIHKYPIDNYHPQYQTNTDSEETITKIPNPCVPCEEPQPCKPTYNPYIPQPIPEPKPCGESSYTHKYPIDNYYPQYPANTDPISKIPNPCVPCEEPQPHKPIYHPIPLPSPEHISCGGSSYIDKYPSHNYYSHYPTNTDSISKIPNPCVPCEEPQPLRPIYNHIPQPSPEPIPCGGSSYIDKYPADNYYPQYPTNTDSSSKFPAPCVPCEEPYNPYIPQPSPEPIPCGDSSNIDKYPTNSYYPQYPTKTDSSVTINEAHESRAPCEEPQPPKPVYNPCIPQPSPEPCSGSSYIHKYPGDDEYPQYPSNTNSDVTIDKIPKPCVPCEEHLPETPQYDPYCPNPRAPCDELQPYKPIYNPYIPQPSPGPKPCGESSYAHKYPTDYYYPQYETNTDSEDTITNIPNSCVPCEEPQPCKPTYNPFIPQPSPEPKHCGESYNIDKYQADTYYPQYPTNTDSNNKLPVPCEEPYNPYIPQPSPEPKPCGVSSYIEKYPADTYYPQYTTNTDSISKIPAPCVPCEEPYNPYIPQPSPEPKLCSGSSYIDKYPADTYYPQHPTNTDSINKIPAPCVPCEETYNPYIPKPSPEPKPCGGASYIPKYPTDNYYPQYPTNTDSELTITNIPNPFVPCEKPQPQTPRYNPYCPHRAPPCSPSKEIVPDPPKYYPHFPKPDPPCTPYKGTLPGTTYNQYLSVLRPEPYIKSTQSFEYGFGNEYSSFQSKANAETIVNEAPYSSGVASSEPSPLYHRQFSLENPKHCSGTTPIPPLCPSENPYPEVHSEVEPEIITDAPSCEEPIPVEPVCHPKFPAKIQDPKPCPETYHEEDVEYPSPIKSKPVPIGCECEEPAPAAVDCDPVVPVEPEVPGPCPPECPAPVECVPCPAPIDVCSGEEDIPCSREEVEEPSVVDQCACPEDELVEEEEENCGGEVDDEEVYPGKPTCDIYEAEDSYPDVKPRSFIPCAPLPKPNLKPALPPKPLLSWNLPKWPVAPHLQKPLSSHCPPCHRCPPCSPCKSCLFN